VSLVGSHRPGDDLAQIDVAPLERDARRPRPREVEQPLGEVLEARNVLLRGVDEPARRGCERVVPAEQLDRHAQRRERAPELVRERGDELLEPRLLIAEVGDVLERQD